MEVDTLISPDSGCFSREDQGKHSKFRNAPHHLLEPGQESTVFWFGLPRRASSPSLSLFNGASFRLFREQVDNSIVDNEVAVKLQPSAKAMLTGHRCRIAALLAKTLNWPDPHRSPSFSVIEIGSV